MVTCRVLIVFSIERLASVIFPIDMLKYAVPRQALRTILVIVFLAMTLSVNLLVRYYYPIAHMNAGVPAWLADWTSVHNVAQVRLLLIF